MADPFIVPKADYSWLSQLPQEFAQGEQLGREDAIRRAFSGGIPMKDGVIDYPSIMQTLGRVDPAKALTFAASMPQLSPYERAEISQKGRSQEIDSAKAVISSYPLSRRDYFAANPDQAPADYQAAIATLRGGDQGPPAPGSVPAPGGATPTAMTPQKGMSYEKWNLIKTGKMAPPEQAKAQIDSVDQMLDNTKEQLQKALDNPHLAETFGGIGSMLGGQSASGATGMWPGSYNVLPAWATAGTSAADAHAQIESIKSQLSTVVINAVKEASGKIGGSTGLGRVLQAEFSAWGNFFGSLDKATSVEQAKDTLRNAIKFIDQSKARHKRTYEADYGDIEGQSAPAEAPVTAEAPLNAPPVPGAMQPIQRDPRGALYPPQPAAAPQAAPSGGVIDYKDYFGQ